MAPQAGFEAKIRVNGQVYAGAEYSVRDAAGDVDTTNTEGEAANPDGPAPTPGAESHLGGSQAARVTIKQASFDPDANPFQAPTALNVGTWAHIQIFPAGLGGVSFNHPSVLILESNYSGTAKMGQPLEFSGITDGGYTDAGT